MKYVLYYPLDNKYFAAVGAGLVDTRPEAYRFTADELLTEFRIKYEDVTTWGATNVIPDNEQAPAKDGKKFDSGKAPIWQGFENYFPNAIFGVAWVSEYGNRKYMTLGAPPYDNNWRNVPNGIPRYKDAEGRHRLSPAIGDDYDAESGLAHLQQKAWNALADLEAAVREGKIELRRGNEIGPDGKPIPGTYRKV